MHGKELHWLIDGGLTDSSVKTAVLAKALGMPNTRSCDAESAPCQTVASLVT